MGKGGQGLNTGQPEKKKEGKVQHKRTKVKRNIKVETRGKNNLKTSNKKKKGEEYIENENWVQSRD